MNRLPKYVASTTLTEPLEWRNSRLLQGDIAEAVRELKLEVGGDLRIIGSAQLANTLIQRRRLEGTGSPVETAGAR